MELARCILLLLQFLLHLLFIDTNLPHILSLNQSFSCFLQIVPAILSLVNPFTFFIYFMYHCLHQNIFRLSQNMTIPPHTIHPCQLSVASFNANMSISSSVFLLPTNFTPHIALTIDLFATLKIATSFSFKHDVLLPMT